MLADAGLHEKAQGLLEATTARARHRVPAILSAWLAAAGSEVAAEAGDADRCRAGLDGAAALLAGAEAVPEAPFVVLDEEHLLRWSGSSLAKLGAHEAIEHLEAARRALPLDFARARASLLADLVAAYAAGGELAEATRLFPDAYALGVQAESERQLRRLRLLHEHLRNPKGQLAG